MHSGKWLIGESNTAFNDMLSATFGQFKKKIVDQVSYYALSGRQQAIEAKTIDRLSKLVCSKCLQIPLSQT